MSTLTFTQIIENKRLYDLAVAALKAKADARVTATVTRQSAQKSATTRPTSAKRAKWAFQVLAVVETLDGLKVEAFDDYTFARKWTAALGGGVVYKRDMVADYSANHVALKDGMQLHQPETSGEPEELAYFGA